MAARPSIELKDVPDEWAALHQKTGPPTVPERDDEGVPRDTSGGKDLWWLPPTAALALADESRSDGWWLLREFAERRDTAVYGVVEELTDEVVGLTAHPWPLVDEGRLRFPVNSDFETPLVERDEFTPIVNGHRDFQVELGLLDPGLAHRTISFGDAFALWDADIELWKSKGPVAKLLRGGAAYVKRTGLGPKVEERGRTLDALALLDITFDAKTASKLAHVAAHGGVIAEDRHQALVEEAALRGLEAMERPPDA